MAPFVQEFESISIDSIPKTKLPSGNAIFDHDNVPKPVADDFMYDFKFNHPLPTTDILGVEIPANCDAQKEAESIVSRLSEVLGSGDAQGFTDLFLEYG